MLIPPDSRLAELLAGRPMARIRWGLDRMERMMAALGHPHRAWRSLHIGGTNGKGSAAAIAEAILRAGGYATGLYTSPHLVTFGERIRLGGRAASAELLERCAADVLPLAREEEASFFEAATALAFLVFARAEVEIAVIEVGLGGRLDATNILFPEVAAVTGVALDHAEYLGDTVEAIAAEKAGILKPGVPAVVGPMSPEVLGVFRRRATEVGAPLARVGAEARVEILDVGRQGTSFRYRSRRWPEGLALRTPLIGRHQATNATVALLAVERAQTLPVAAVRTGVAGVRWPGRFQIVERPDGTWVFDVAHNVAGAQALADTLDDVPLPEPRVALIAILGDKPWREILVPLLERVEAAVFTLAPSAPAERLWDPSEARAAVGSRVEVERDFEAALRRSRVLAGRGTVLVTGSCHTVGDALARLEAVAPGASARGLVDDATAIR